MDYSILGIIITVVVGIPGILWLIYWQREKRKDKLKSIIMRGVNEFTRYSELYKYLYNYHANDIEKLRSKYRIINRDYFIKIFCNKIEFSNDESRYRFPLLFKQNWLRSNNKELQLNLGGLTNNCMKNYLTPLSNKFLKRFGISDYIDFLKNECKKNVWGQTTFDLYGLKENDNTLVLSCCKGNYIHFVKTYELIQKELYYNHIHNENKFSLREEIRFVRLEDYSLRPAKIGINVFTIMKRKDGGFSTFIHKRRTDQVEYPEFYHVAPAGTFQPISEHNIMKQYSFGFTVFREFLEELFDLEKADKEYRESDPIKIFSLAVERPEKDLPPVCPGELLLGKKPNLSKTITKKYELIPTGFLTDITSFKPELTFVLYIKDEEIHKTLSNYISGCWEADIGEYDLSGNALNGNFFEFTNKHLNTDEFLPAGAVAVSEGIRWYIEHLL